VSLATLGPQRRDGAGVRTRPPVDTRLIKLIANGLCGLMLGPRQLGLLMQPMPQRHRPINQPGP